MGEKQDDIILKVDHLTKTFQVKSPRLFEKPLALNGVNQLVQDAIRNQQSQRYDQYSGESPG